MHILFKKTWHTIKHMSSHAMIKRWYQSRSPHISHATQFTNLPHADLVHQQYKPQETSVIVRNILTQSKPKAPYYTILDVGGSHGWYLLQALHEHGIDALIHVVEPDLKQLNAYKKHAQQFSNIRIGQCYDQPIQCLVQPPTSDVILCSHSLYYTKPLWHNSGSIFFNWLTSALQPKGAWIVALQSSDRHLCSKNTPLLEDIEDFTYPIRAALQNMECKTNSSRNTYATASMFHASIACNSARFRIQSDVVVSHVDTQHHPSAFQEFYSGGLWDQFSCQQQHTLDTMIADGVTHATEIISLQT